MRIQQGLPDAGDLERLLSAWPFKPHQWTARGADEAIARLLQARLLDGASRDDVTVWSACAASGEPLGVAALHRLSWDTRVLELPAARVDLLVTGTYANARAAVDALLGVAIDHARQAGVKHVSSRVDASDDAAIHGLETHGFLNVDALVTFAARVEDLPLDTPITGVQIRPSADGDVDSLIELAAASFRHGRFHSDPSIPAHRAASVYREWTRGCCQGSAADVVIVADEGDQPVGFVACRIPGDTTAYLGRPIGTIPLIAAGERVRGRGVGTALIAGARQWFASRHAAAVEVGTQLRNGAAARLYERCGFRTAAGALSFRRIIEP